MLVPPVIFRRDLPRVFRTPRYTTLNRAALDVNIKRVRRDFQMRCISISTWARENGYDPAYVHQILGGYSACSRGQAYEIAVKLGLIKPQPQQLAA